jgi:hypothetical protein
MNSRMRLLSYFDLRLRLCDSKHFPVVGKTYDIAAFDTLLYRSRIGAWREGSYG